jgi:hypothetical protein
MYNMITIIYDMITIIYDINIRYDINIYKLTLI